MSGRLFRAGWDDSGAPRDIPGDRCMVGRHKIEHQKGNYAWFVIDNKVLCYRHVIDVIEASDAFRGQPGMSPLEMLRWRQKNDTQKAITARKATMRAVGGRAPGYVYYIRIDQHIKIGYATDIANRMKAYPPSAVLLAAHPGTKETEKQMHQDFNAYLDRGREWFRQGKSLMAHIEQVVAKYGDPKVLGYEYTHAKRVS